MPSSLPPLGWFRTFEAAARRQSFTAAADELGLTQSAVSQQIGALESRLRCRLFVRKPRGVALTEEARRLLPEVSRSIDALRSVSARFLPPPSANRLTIATSVSIAQWILAPRLTRFLDGRPDVDIRLSTRIWPDEPGGSEADVHIRFGAARAEARRERVLGDDRLILVAAPSLIGTPADTALDADALQALPLIHTLGTVDTWRERAVGFGLDAACPATLSVDAYGIAVDLARHGAGVAMTLESVARPALAEGSLVRVRPERLPAHDVYRIDTRDDLPLAEAFADWLLSEMGGPARDPDAGV